MISSAIKRYRGFSLVELLVVLLIIGLGFSFVSFNVDDNRGLRLQIEAKQFANNTALIAEEAVLDNQQWGVDIYRELVEGEEVFGYRWLVRSEQGFWQLATTDRRQLDFLFSSDLSMRLELEGNDDEVEVLLKRELAEQGSMVVDDDSITEMLGANTPAPDETIEPAIWLLSSGEMSAFTMRLFVRSDPELFVLIKGDELGRIVVEGESPDE